MLDQESPEIMDSETKNYEIAYLIAPDLNEDEASSRAQKAAGLIEASKGIVRYAERPRKRVLAYPIKKVSQAHFGWTTFSMATEFLPDMEKKIKDEKLFLRHLIVEEAKAEPERPRLRVIPPSAAKPMVRLAVRPEESAELDLESLDKKLEEILGK